MKPTIERLSSWNTGLGGSEADPPPTVPAWLETLKDHWFLYLFEGAELALFMASACAFSVLLFDPQVRIPHLAQNAAVRRLLMGVAMGITAVLIIHSPMGKRSGAHFNPAITLTYLRLHRIAPWDALFYVVGQFLGGVFGVGISACVLGSALARPPMLFAITVPGLYGTPGAFLAELFMATLLMGTVLWSTNRPAIAAYTSHMVGTLICIDILVFAPISGFSINPARTVASAVFAHIWTAVWLYFGAPLGGMLLAAELYVRQYGIDSVLCAKLHPEPGYLCSFRCHFPGHVQD